MTSFSKNTIHHLQSLPFNTLAHLCNYLTLDDLGAFLLCDKWLRDTLTTQDMWQWKLVENYNATFTKFDANLSWQTFPVLNGPFPLPDTRSFWIDRENLSSRSPTSRWTEADGSFLFEPTPENWEPAHSPARHYILYSRFRFVFDQLASLQPYVLAAGCNGRDLSLPNRYGLLHGILRGLPRRASEFNPAPLFAPTLLILISQLALQDVGLACLAVPIFRLATDWTSILGDWVPAAAEFRFPLPVQKRRADIFGLAEYVILLSIRHLSQPHCPPPTAQHYQALIQMWKSFLRLDPRPASWVRHYQVCQSIARTTAKLSAHMLWTGQWEQVTVADPFLAFHVGSRLTEELQKLLTRVSGHEDSTTLTGAWLDSDSGTPAQQTLIMFCIHYVALQRYKGSELAERDQISVINSVIAIFMSSQSRPVLFAAAAALSSGWELACRNLPSFCGHALLRAAQLVTTESAFLTDNLPCPFWDTLTSLLTKAPRSLKLLNKHNRGQALDLLVERLAGPLASKRPFELRRLLRAAAVLWSVDSHRHARQRALLHACLEGFAGEASGLSGSIRAEYEEALGHGLVPAPLLPHLLSSRLEYLAEVPLGPHFAEMVNVTNLLLKDAPNSNSAQVDLVRARVPDQSPRLPFYQAMGPGLAAACRPSPADSFSSFSSVKYSN